MNVDVRTFSRNLRKSSFCAQYKYGQNHCQIVFKFYTCLNRSTKVAEWLNGARDDKRDVRRPSRCSESQLLHFLVITVVVVVVVVVVILSL